AAQYEPVMGDDAYFSHITAAVLWDAPLPGHLFRSRRDEPPVFDPEALDVSIPWPGRAPRGEGVVGHSIRARLANSMVHRTSGLRIASPAATWAMLVGRLWHPYDLVAVADYFVHVRRSPFSR